MSPTVKGLIAVGITAAVGYAAYRYFMQNKRAYVRVLLKNNVTTGSSIALMTFDEGFLREWAKAARKNDSNFSYNSKQYKTIGGTAV